MGIVIIKRDLFRKLFIFILLFAFGMLEAEENSSKLPEIIKIKDGVYKFGSVIIDRKLNSLSIPSISNQVNGLVEYGIVHENGKIHESLFRTKVRPQILHTSMLLLKAKPVDTFFDNIWSKEPKLIDYSEDCLEILVFWESNGTKFEKRMEELSFNQNRKGTMQRKSFIFTGSRMVEGIFLAESTGSILAIYADDNAIINNCDYDNTNDDVWIANKKEMPSLELPVTIRFNLPMDLD